MLGLRRTGDHPLRFTLCSTPAHGIQRHTPQTDDNLLAA